MAHHTLPSLPYDPKSLEPVISQKIMQLHHDKHHAAYVNNLNKALEGTGFEQMPLETLLSKLEDVPESVRMTVRNNAGGHYNHSLFWTIMRKPLELNAPSPSLATILSQTFESLENFQNQMVQAGLTRFGSGWSWLAKTKAGKLKIYSLPNQDNPIMQGELPVFGIDVWEHAYYLDYLNDRGAYLTQWWQLLNWDEIEKRLG